MLNLFLQHAMYHIGYVTGICFLFVCMHFTSKMMLRTICHAAPPQHRSVPEYLISVPLTHSQTFAASDVVDASRLIPANADTDAKSADAKMSASAHL